MVANIFPPVFWDESWFEKQNIYIYTFGFFGNLRKNQPALLTKPATCTCHISPADLRIISCQNQALQDTKLQFKALLHHSFHLAMVPFRSCGNRMKKKNRPQKGGRSDQRTLRSTKSQRKDSQVSYSFSFFFPAIVFNPNSKSIPKSSSDDPNTSTVIT